MSSSVNLIIPAAGAATRLRPLSANTSKVMVRVNGKPCLDYIIDQASKITNLEQVVVVDGKFEDIRNYAERVHPEITFANQPDLKGPRDAIAIGMNAITNTSVPTVVWLGDAIILEDDIPLGTDFLLCKEVSDQSAWCMWDGMDFYNKPSTTISNAVALVGLYSFSDTERAIRAFNEVDGYDISESLEVYSNRYERVNTDKWYDIGDLPTYYKTCAQLLNLKSRYFNNMDFDHELGVLTKTPNYHVPESVKTLQSEISWYKDLTNDQKCFTPRVFDIWSSDSLTMSFESGTLLSDLMLYEDLTESAWEYIIDKVFRIKQKYFSSRCTNSKFNSDFALVAHDVWYGKSSSRLEQYSFSDEVNEKILEFAKQLVCATYPIEGMHGDLHFGNILYNQQTDQIKLIDPRGNYGGYIGTYGDNLYDWAKLAHDLYHGYNAMVANTKPNEIVRKVFLEKLKETNLPTDLVLKGGLVLLATCIPLHSDDPDRQDRFRSYVETEINSF
jgi:dTDP-glucose pyrophosphorylase